MNKIPKPIPKLGLYPYSYAAEDIAKQMEFSGGPKMSLLLEMAGAIRKGELQVRNSETVAPFAVPPNMDNPSPYATIAEINRWLALRGFTYRWTRDAGHRGAQPEPPQEQHEALTNPEDQIFDTQSNTTPLPKAAILKIDWPGNVNLERLLSDIPQWLESARTMPGRRGRNGSALWNPARIAICLHTEKRVPKYALAQLIRTHFPDCLSDWEAAIDL